MLTVIDFSISDINSIKSSTLAPAMTLESVVPKQHFCRNCVAYKNTFLDFRTPKRLMEREAPLFSFQCNFGAGFHV